MNVCREKVQVNPMKIQVASMILALALLAAGCAVQQPPSPGAPAPTTQQVVAQRIASARIAIAVAQTGIRVVYLAGDISPAEMSRLMVASGALSDGLNAIQADNAAGLTDTATVELDALDAALADLTQLRVPQVMPTTKP